jgi:lysophospholipase L1-like esterase
MIVRARVLGLIGAGLVVVAVVVAALWIAAEPRSATSEPSATPSPTGATATPSPTATHTFSGTAKIAFLGDSFVAGYGGGGGSYVDRVGTILDATITADGVVGSGIVNFGQGLPYGQRVDALLASNPDILVIQGSVNDLQTSSSAVAAAAQSLVERAKAHRPRVKVVLVGPIYLASEVLPALLEQRASLAAVARNAKITYVDPNGWITDVTAPTLIGPDRIHPTAAGYSVIATKMAEQLEPVVDALP